MAEPKTSASSVSVKSHEDGSLSIGVTVGGYFVPFVTLAAYRIAQLVENAQTLAASEPSASAEEAPE